MLNAYLVSLVSLVVIDSVWLYSMAGFYRAKLGHVFAENFSLIPASVFYLCYVGAILYFVVYPVFSQGVSHSTILGIFLKGLLFGAIVYSAYDLTNQATIKNWPVLVTIVDITWGAVLTAVVSVAGWFVLK